MAQKLLLGQRMSSKPSDMMQNPQEGLRHDRISRSQPEIVLMDRFFISSRYGLLIDVTNLAHGYLDVAMYVPNDAPKTNIQRQDSHVIVYACC